jgi:Right handed beta helix region
MSVCTTAALLLLAGAGAWAEGLYVSPDGNGAWSGRLPRPNAAKTDGPLATLTAARDAARALPAGEPRHIVVRGGEYFLESPLVLEAADSGLTIEPAEGEKPVVYGGRRVTGWASEDDRFWAAALPEVAAGKWDFRMLVVNGRFCPRARLPEEGTFAHLTEFNVPWMSTTGGGWQRKPTQDELTHMRVKPEDIGPWLDLRNAEVTVYHMWDESVVGLSALDAATNTLTFSNPAGHPPGAFGVKKYVVWNVREGMTEPGQWYLDRTKGRVVYWPLAGEDMRKAKAIAPTVETIIRLQGTKEAPVRDVAIRGLTLSVTNTPLRAGGFGASNFDGAVSAQFAQGCELAGLTLVNVGGQAVKGGECTGLKVVGCDIHDSGACGIFVSGSDNVIENNLVHDIGVTYPSAIGLWCNGQRATISHNEVHDTPYTGVACGGDDHVIEANLIYHNMKELHDGAGVYITFCKRIVVRGNFIRDITDTGGYGASAYYLDEQAEGCLVEGNLSLRVSRPSHNHMAKDNVIRNNVFVNDGPVTITFPRSSDFRFERNVVVAKEKLAITNPETITSSADNILFSAAGAVEGAPPGTILADPLLEGLEAGKCSFAEGSPARNLPIAPVDVSGAGRRATRTED